jgi:uncharacterized membrane protein YbaN (DUF454 family)
MTTNAFTKKLLIIFGTLSLILGIIGVVIPILPTTPFLLLSAFCYLHGSKRLYKWLLNHKFFGSYIYNYMTYKAIKRSTKIGSVLFLWISLAISIIIVQNLHVRIFLILVGIVVSIHLLMMKTISKEKITMKERLTNKEK